MVPNSIISMTSSKSAAPMAMLNASATRYMTSNSSPQITALNAGKAQHPGERNAPDSPSRNRLAAEPPTGAGRPAGIAAC